MRALAPDKVAQIFYHLTDSDVEIIKKVGLPYKEVESKYGLSAGAYRVRVSIIMDKFGVENRVALAIKAIQLGLVSIDDFEVRTFNGKDW